MADRTIKAVYYPYRNADGFGRVVYRGDPIPDDMTDREKARGERLGAFSDSEVEMHSDALAGIDNNPKQGGGNTPGGKVAEHELAGVAPSELTDQQIDQLSGKALDDAMEMAGIDTTQGGSLADGSLSADEKREALKDDNA
jgi:hypothetical protein